jgi:hypothetical protein
MVEPKRLSVLCQTVSITGSQDFLPGGQISYGSSSIPIRVWVSTLNRTIECREVAHPENTRQFGYLEHYVNLTESSLIDIVAQEKIVYPLHNESLLYYYGGRWELDSGQGRNYHIGSCGKEDRYGFRKDPIETCEGYYCFFFYYLPSLVIRLTASSLAMALIITGYMVVNNPNNFY